jgi:hypothetical protein
VQVVSLEPIDVLAAVATDADDAGGLEDMEVSCRRRPAVGEPLGQVPRRQLGPDVRQELDDVPAGLVGQCAEDRRGLLERGTDVVGHQQED